MNSFKKAIYSIVLPTILAACSTTQAAPIKTDSSSIGATPALEQIVTEVSASMPSHTPTTAPAVEPTVTPEPIKYGILFSGFCGEPEEDGSQILKICSMEHDGTGLTNITKEGMGYTPSFSPDGKTIAFTYEPYPNKESQIIDIYLMDRDGSNPRPLITTEFQEFDPSWSPDGSRIAYVSNQTEKGSYHIFVMDADGSDIKDITTTKTGTGPRWSPDGKRIAYVGIQDGRFDIFTMSGDGSDVKRVTSGQLDSYMFPAWSPDGNQIMFSGIHEDQTSDIYIINADGTGLEKVIDKGKNDVGAVWSPDGKEVIFTPDDGNADAANGKFGSIYRMDLETKELTCISDTQGSRSIVPYIIK